ncbi:MAG TPA: cytosine permease, partial [Candidatus Dormibacteraeota bacterium]|nr:cytosine permease [Candidatus Dormibacteraeota bacterium]
MSDMPVTDAHRRDDRRADDELFRIEERGLEAVPDGARHGHPRELFFIWAAALADFFSFFAGAILINPLGLGVLDGAAVLVLGAVAGAALLGPLSVTGVRSGLPQIMYSRLAFGRRGAMIGGALTALIAIGWFAYDCAIAVQTAKSASVFGADGPPQAVTWAMLAVMVVACILVAVYGHRTITVVQTVQAPLFLAICGGIAVALWSRFDLGLGATVAGRDHVAALLLGFTATFALIVSWVTYAADYSRYLPRATGGWRVGVASGAGSVVTLVLCGLLGLAVQSSNPGDSLLADPGIIVNALPAWFAWTFVVFIVVAEMSSNYLNVYTAALSALACGVRLRRWPAALVVGLLGGAFAGWILHNGATFQTTYYNFLTATYVWFPAWCVVVLVDFARRRGRVDAAEASRPLRSWSDGWRIPAVATLILGTLATFAFYNASALGGYSGFATRL